MPVAATISLPLPAADECANVRRPSPTRALQANGLPRRCGRRLLPGWLAADEGDSSRDDGFAQASLSTALPPGARDPLFARHLSPNPTRCTNLAHPRPAR